MENFSSCVDYSIITSSSESMKEYYDKTDNKPKFLSYVSNLGTYESLVFIREVSKLENFDNLANSISISGDINALYFLDRHEDIFLHLEELLSSSHYHIVEWVFEQYGDHLIEEYASSSTPLVYEYCVRNSIMLDLVVKQACDSVRGEVLASLLNRCIDVGYYPTLEVSVKSNSKVVERLLAYDPEQNEDMIALSIDSVVNNDIAIILLTYFPEFEFTTETIINAMIHHLTSIIEKFDNVEILQEICEIEYSYWENYSNDLIWLFNNIDIKEKFKSFKIHPNIISILGKERQKDLLILLLNNFDII